VLEYELEHVKEGVLRTKWDAILQESLTRVKILSLRDFVKGLVSLGVLAVVTACASAYPTRMPYTYAASYKVCFVGIVLQ
jgi:hypothetical protein